MPVKKKSKATAVDILTEQVRKLEERVSALESLAPPAPTKLPLRERCVRLVTQMSDETGVAYNRLWRCAYGRLHMPELYNLADIHNIRKLDVVERAGRLDDLHKILCGLRDYYRRC